MAFFDELKKNLSGVTDTVAKTSENVMKKSSTAIEIQKAKLKKVSLEGDMKELYASLGKLYFEEYADGYCPKCGAEIIHVVEEDENVDAASSEEVDDEVPDGADTEDSEGEAEEVDAEPEESAEANEQEDEAAKETEEGEASDECTDNE